ncbi:MAG TPA: WHG domain-containing protein [Aestuariivirga sp.]|nr:WHG domain-containing protein [Aestuariivirga sp.]
MAKKTAKTYHHGDLREALIKAGRTILEKDGIEALTLRACARKAGVSHAAPQHHFASVSDLLAEIAATGFEDFVKALDKDAARAPSPVEKLKAMGQSYVAFARERPAVYQLMFGVGAPQSSERLQAAKVAAWEQLANAVSAAAGPDNNEAKAMQVWSAVHGFSMLVISQRLPPIINVPQALKRVIDGLAPAIGARP